jgi:hypothetical protein
MRCWLTLIALALGMQTSAAQPAPTASEIFELRRNCYDQGQKILAQKSKDEWRNGKGELSETPTGFVQTNYDNKTGNCYAIITYVFKPPNKRVDRILFDALNNKALAGIMDENSDDKYGYIDDKTVDQEKRVNIAEVEKYFDMRMSVKR